MQHTLADLFGIETRWETQERITLHRQSAGKLCEFLGDVSQSAVVDETGLAGRYDFDIPYQHGQPEVTSQALKAIGLELVEANRKVKVLVVSPK